MNIHKIICGSTLNVLANLPPESVDMVLTSPPYWGLRDYGRDTATIWGGGKDCEHEWIDGIKKGITGGKESYVQRYIWKKKNLGLITGEVPDSKYAFCSKCGAWSGQLGLEPTPKLYIEHLRMVFAEVERVLKKTGTCWVNIGDSYAGGSKGIGSSPDPIWAKAKNDDMQHNQDWDLIDLPAKCMCMIPERFAFMMVNSGYILRNKIIWHKPNSMPTSVKDRFNTTYEMVYFFSKNSKYWFDLDAVRDAHKYVSPKRVKGAWNVGGEPMSSYQGMSIKEMCNPSGKNPGDLWDINTQPFPEAHFAVFPEKLCVKPILAGCPEGGVVLDPFTGSGTVGLVAENLGRSSILIDIKKEYCELARKRLKGITDQTKINGAKSIVTYQSNKKY